VPPRTNMKAICFLVAVLCAFSVAQAVKLKDCGSSAFLIRKNITISNCRGRRCLFTRGKEAQIELPFIPRQDVETMKLSVNGILGGVNVPFRLENDDGCQTSSPPCPLTKGRPVNFKYSLKVQPFYPKLSLSVRWRILDGAGNNLVCLIFPVTIV